MTSFATRISLFRILLSGLAILLGSAAAVAQEAADTQIVVLSPMQVVAKSTELVAHFATYEGKKTLKYIRVKNVTTGSMPGRAGLNKRDRIVAIGVWRLEGQELTALLNRDFSTNSQDGEAVLSLTVHRSGDDKEHEILFRYRQKNPDQSPKPTLE
jgi:hypothetical protein